MTPSERAKELLERWGWGGNLRLEKELTQTIEDSVKEERNKKPKITWIKNDPTEHQLFSDGSIFLVALRVTICRGPCKWDFDVVKINCDDESMHLEDREGNSYDAWSWEDFEYFALIEGEIPIRARGEKGKRE